MENLSVYEGVSIISRTAGQNTLNVPSQDIDKDKWSIKKPVAAKKTEGKTENKEEEGNHFAVEDGVRSG